VNRKADFLQNESIRIANWNALVLTASDGRIRIHSVIAYSIIRSAAMHASKLSRLSRVSTAVRTTFARINRALQFRRCSENGGLANRRSALTIYCRFARFSGSDACQLQLGRRTIEKRTTLLHVCLRLRSLRTGAVIRITESTTSLVMCPDICPQF